MVTKVTFQPRTPEKVASKVKSLNSFALFTRSVLFISIDNKQKLGFNFLRVICKGFTEVLSRLCIRISLESVSPANNKLQPKF